MALPCKRTTQRGGRDSSVRQSGVRGVEAAAGSPRRRLSSVGRARGGRPRGLSWPAWAWPRWGGSMHGTMLPPPLRSPALLPLGGTFQKKHHLPTPAPEPPRPISAQLAKSSSSQPPGTLLLQAFCPLSPLRHLRPHTAWVPSRSGSVVSAPGPQSDDTPTASRPTGRGPRPPNHMHVTPYLLCLMSPGSRRQALLVGPSLKPQGSPQPPADL